MSQLQQGDVGAAQGGRQRPRCTTLLTLAAVMGLSPALLARTAFGHYFCVSPLFPSSLPNSALESSSCQAAHWLPGPATPKAAGTALPGSAERPEALPGHSGLRVSHLAAPRGAPPRLPAALPRGSGSHTPVSGTAQEPHAPETTCSGCPLCAPHLDLTRPWRHGTLRRLFSD